MLMPPKNANTPTVDLKDIANTIPTWMILNTWRDARLSFNVIYKHMTTRMDAASMTMASRV